MGRTSLLRAPRREAYLSSGSRGTPQTLIGSSSRRLPNGQRRFAVAVHSRSSLTYQTWFVENPQEKADRQLNRRTLFLRLEFYEIRQTTRRTGESHFEVQEDES